LPEILLLAVVAFIGALVFGITGFGAALFTIPLATHLVPLKFALALYVLTDLACALRVGFENPRNALRAEWTRLVPMIALGTAVGATLLMNLPRQAATAALGLFIVVYATYSLFRIDLKKPISSAWAWVAGFAGGITSTVFGAGGPPYIIYLSRRGLEPAQLRATMGFATLTSISLRTIAFLLTGLLLDPEVWLAAAAAVPAALVGIEVARRVYLRMPRALLMRAFALVLLVSGSSLLWRSFH
jgi:uncharacterized membrane protein YfcA